MSQNCLTPESDICHIPCGDITLRFRKHPESGITEFLPIPSAQQSLSIPRVQSRALHPSFKVHEGLGGVSWGDLEWDSMFQIALRGEAGHRMWHSGETMRNHETAQKISFTHQEIEESEHTTVIKTHAKTQPGVEACQTLTWHHSSTGLLAETTVTNHTQEAISLEMLASVSLAGITPFAADDAPNRLKLHRFRSAWSNEGRHEAADFEDLHLERTWGGGAVFTRFGQTGSLPVRNFFPFAAIEDTQSGTVWAVQHAWHGSWQMEVYRRYDGVALSAGLGDFERAHWMKTLAPGESFTSPTALLTVCQGGIEDACHQLVELQQHLAYEEPEHEKDLPIIFNEWCSSWGKPTHDYLIRTADRLKETSTKYLVIDDGWAEKPEGADIQFNGDWNICNKAFPLGLNATTAAIRERGLIPGIWFEFEPCTEGTEAFKLTDHHLQRHGKVLQVGSRHFWDFRDPWTWDYLREKVIHLLRDNDFGYLKVDYNECIGIGCDGAESLGEGMRQHLVQVKKFFEAIRKEVPGIVIENCASGGHRLEPGMLGVGSMSSFSDAHETVEIPIIGANLHRLIPVHKNQIWAVLRSDDDLQRINYSLSATFLGRMCISGDLVELSEDRFACVKAAQQFYQKLIPTLRIGKSSLYQNIGKSYRYPTGWQAVVRTSNTGNRCMVVLHTFEAQQEKTTIRIPLPENAKWEIDGTFNTMDCHIEAGYLMLSSPLDFTGMAWSLKSL